MSSERRLTLSQVLTSLPDRKSRGWVRKFQDSGFIEHKTKYGAGSKNYLYSDSLKLRQAAVLERISSERNLAEKFVLDEPNTAWLDAASEYAKDPQPELLQKFLTETIARYEMEPKERKLLNHVFLGTPYPEYEQLESRKKSYFKKQLTSTLGLMLLGEIITTAALHDHLPTQKNDNS